MESEAESKKQKTNSESSNSDYIELMNSLTAPISDFNSLQALIRLWNRIQR